MKYFVCLAMFLLVGSFQILAAPPITAIAITPGGKQVLLGSQLGIEIRALADLTLVDKIATELEHVDDLRFSPDGRCLLIAGGSPAESGRVEVWTWPKCERIRDLSGHDDVVYRVACSPDGTQCVTCSGDGTCLVFSTVTWERLTQYEGHSRGVLACVYLDDRTIATAGIDQTIRIWNGADGSHLRTLDNHVAAVNAIALRPASSEQSGEVIASISEDRTVRLWQPRIGRLMRFVRLASVPRSLAWSRAGTKIYVGCNDGRVRIIDAENMAVVTEFDGLVGRIYELAVDTNAEHLVMAGEIGCRVRIKD